MNKRQHNSLETINSLNMKLHVPYNNDPVLVERLLDYKEFIDSVYLAPNSSIILTSGQGTLPVSPKNYDLQVKTLVKKLMREGIKPYMLFNSYYVNQKTINNFKNSDFFRYFKKMHNFGINHVTVTDILLAKNIKLSFPDIKIEVSVNEDVETVTKALYWDKFVGIDSICISLNINKKLKSIENIKKATSKKITLMAHEICIPHCPYTIQHSLGCLSKKKLGLPVYFNCSGVMMRKPWIVFQGPIVVPANLRFYKNIVDKVKIAGRRYATEHIVDLIKHYALNLNSRAYFYNYGFNEQGTNVFPYLKKFVINGIKHPYLYEEPKGVLDKVSECQGNCAQCRWCYRLWKSMDFKSPHSDIINKMSGIYQHIKGPKEDNIFTSDFMLEDGYHKL